MTAEETRLPQSRAPPPVSVSDSESKRPLQEVAGGSGRGDAGRRQTYTGAGGGCSKTSFGSLSAGFFLAVNTQKKHASYPPSAKQYSDKRIRVREEPMLASVSCWPAAVLAAALAKDLPKRPSAPDP